MKTRFGLILLLGFLFCRFDGICQKMKSPERGFISSKQASNWEEGLISGNGVIGINALSRPLDETIIFSHAKLFLPIRDPYMPPDNGDRITEIRELIDRGLYRQATELAAKLSGQDDFMGPDPFVPAFDLNLHMDSKGDIKDYVRAVDFMTGEAKVQWMDDRGRFERKIFVSRADSLAVLLITGPARSVNIKLDIDSRKPENSLDINTLVYSYDTYRRNIGNVKRISRNNDFIFKNDFTHAYPGSVQKLEGVARVVYNNGEIVQNDKSVEIRRADKVLVFINLSLLYDSSVSAEKEMIARMDALPTDYDALLKKHTAIHGSIFMRMKLDLSGGADRNLTTEELIEKSTMGNTNRALIEKQFDAGRYNILCSMGERPPALAGIWGGTYTPPWSGDYTHNGNVPSAIASVLMGNMPELMKAYTSYIESMVYYMEINAKNMFGARGVVLPSRSSTTAFNNALNPTFAGGFWVAGAAWAAHFFYDYYLYTGDKKFLLEHALPFMEKCVLFFEDYLYEGSDGKYIFSPTQSPENTPKNSDSQGSFNATMDVAAAREVITNTITTSRLLGVNQDKIQLWKSMLERLPDYMINKEGHIKEWLTPKLENNDDHRHASQLYALYDGITPEIANNPVLMKSFKKSIEHKLNTHWRNNKTGYMSFGIVQLGQASASLGEGELAYECLKYLANRFWLSNLASMHNHRTLFNMDVSGGMPSVIIKMLVFSDPGIVSLIPALPTEWENGSIEGVLCRGQIEIESLKWERKKLNVKMRSAVNQIVTLRLPGEIQGIQVKSAIKTRVRDGKINNEKLITLPAKQTIEFEITLK